MRGSALYTGILPRWIIMCIPPNKIPYTTMLPFVAITDTGIVSIYIHIMDINTTGCIPPNKIIQTTMLKFGGITDTGIVSIYIHIMDINTTGCIPLNKII